MAPTNIICSGALFYATTTKRFLFLQRTDDKTKGLWGLCGGMAKYHESAFEGLKREISEEVGETPAFKKVIPLELFTSKDEKFYFHTYVILVDKEFIPTLNSEHSGYCWCDIGTYPKPLHVGLRNTLQNKINQTKIQTVSEIANQL